MKPKTVFDVMQPELVEIAAEIDELTRGIVIAQHQLDAARARGRRLMSTKVPLGASDEATLDAIECQLLACADPGEPE